MSEGQTILVVDDEEAITRTLKGVLEDEGYRTVLLGDGSQVLAALAEHKPDLVILDLMLPDVSGTDLCRKLRSDPGLAWLPIIMLTAKSAEIDRIVSERLSPFFRYQSAVGDGGEPKSLAAEE